MTLLQRDARIQRDTAAGYPIIVSVDPDTPAQRAGLTAGDTILAYDAVNARAHPDALIKLLHPHRQILFRIRHNGVRTIRVRVKDWSPSSSVMLSEAHICDPAVDAAPLVFSLGDMGGSVDQSVTPIAGARLVPLDADLSQAIKVGTAGVFVIDILPGSRADRWGLKSGDVIVQAGAMPVRSPLDVMKAIGLVVHHADRSQWLVLSVIRRGRSQQLTLRR